VTRWLHWTPEQYELLKNPGNCELWVMELQPDGRYQMATPMRIEPPAHENAAIPNGYAELMPLRNIPIVQR
jgi:hypothetical protein